MSGPVHVPETQRYETNEGYGESPAKGRDSSFNSFISSPSALGRLAESTAALILGIDPGATGALAVIDPATHTVVDVLDVPTLALGNWSVVDGAAVSTWLERNPFDVAVLERVDARPTDGRGSIAAFGRNVGGLAALLTATGKPLALVTPTTWKRRAGLIDQPKRASLELAKLTFGAAAAERWFPLKKHHGRAEAALIALYGSSA